MDGDVLNLEAKLLAARAKRLATRRDHAAEPAPDYAMVLTFRLGEERFALNVAQVALVVPLARLTSVPGADPALLGVMAVKGEIYSIFDLTRLLGLTLAPASTGYVLVCKRLDARVGVLVAQVDQIAAARPGGRLSDGRRLVQVGAHEMVWIEDLEQALAPHIHGDGQ